METPVLVEHLKTQHLLCLFGDDKLLRQEHGNGGLLLLTQGCVYANRAESVTNGWVFSLGRLQGGEKSGIACSERLFMIYWDYKQNEWVDFYHLKSGCFHTLRSHNCIQT